MNPVQDLGPECTLHEAEVIWDVTKHAPGLYDSLESGERQWVAAWCDHMTSALPVSDTFRPFMGAKYFRPLGHARSLYRTIDGTASHTLCIKGTESMSP